MSFNQMKSIPLPLHVEDLQAVTHPVAVVLRDVVELPVGAFNRVTITALALPLHGVILLGGIIDVGEHQLVQIAVGEE